MKNRSNEIASVADRLKAARNGSRQALGEALNACRHYLLMVANRELDADLQGKVAPSDLVQETFLEAQRAFDKFQGTSEEELLAWLKRILANNVANAVRHYKGAGKRTVALEVPFANVPPDAVPALGYTPESQALLQERDVALHQALLKLPETARQVIQWRNYELCSFEEIGTRLGRSAEAVRKIWTRALIQLQTLLEPPYDSRG